MDEDEAPPPSNVSPGPGDSTATATDEDGDPIAILVLKKGWDLEHVEKIFKDGKQKWKGKWYGLSFSPVHATRVLYHWLKIRKRGITICKSAIPNVHKAAYEDLYNRNVDKVVALKRAKEETMDLVMLHQNRSVEAVLKKGTYKLPMRTTHPAPPPSAYLRTPLAFQP